MGSQVWIEGIQPVDQDMARAQQDFIEEFGEIVEDDPEATAGMTALLGSIGEENEGSGGSSGKVSSQTTAQRAGSRHQRDPLMSPVTGSSALRRDSAAGSPSPSRAAPNTKSRTKSFVGLTIVSSSGSPQAASYHGPSRSASVSQGLGLAGTSGANTPTMHMGMMSPSTSHHHQAPILDRGPGSTLFPSSFSTLSAEPNLGRAASGLVGGLKSPDVENQFSHGGWAEMKRGLGRKQSGTGLSESEYSSFWLFLSIRVGEEGSQRQAPSRLPASRIMSIQQVTTTN
jgi:hypothetical protein